MEPYYYVENSRGLNPLRTNFDRVVQRLKEQRARIIFLTSFDEPQLNENWGLKKSEHYDELILKPADPEDKILPVMERVFGLRRLSKPLRE